MLRSCAAYAPEVCSIWKEMSQALIYRKEADGGGGGGRFSFVIFLMFLRAFLADLKATNKNYIFSLSQNS